MAAIGQLDNCGRVKRQCRTSTECFVVIDVIVVVVAALIAASDGHILTTPQMTEFDLNRVHRKETSCADRSTSDEIIVCAPKNKNIWISDADKARFSAKPLRVEFTGPLNSETKIHVIQSRNPNAVTPAAAATLKWHF